MHALPRGPELPDSLMSSKRSLVDKQVDNGLSMRSTVLRWLIEL
jgi:aspartate carbamoyltransferase catalytic subunit